MKFLNDEYTLEIDDLGYKAQVAIIRDVIINADTPFSLGISGRWGSGKTSVMKYLMASFGGESRRSKLDTSNKQINENIEFQKIARTYADISALSDIHTIWFNPWESENYQEPMIGLLEEIHHHFSIHAKLIQKSKKLLTVAIQSGLDTLGNHLKLGKNKATSIMNIAEKYEYENFEHMERNQKFKLIFENAIKNLLTDIDTQNVSKNARIVIFIDDLDRCEDTTIAKLLKEIKQYLATKRCVFIFGYDRHHIEKSLSKTETKTNKETRAYLEKLFQTTFYIKEPKKEKLNEFVKIK